MIIVFEILGVLIEIFIFLYVVADLVLIVRNNKYQKLWNREKANIVRIDPAITYPQLCEKYVIFCKKNDCKVDF